MPHDAPRISPKKKEIETAKYEDNHWFCAKLNTHSVGYRVQ